jgi:hypothetical protein
MRRSILLAALLVALSGCASSSTRFWTIEPAAAPPTASIRTTAPIKVAAVHLPLALDRLEVVRHDAVDRVQVMDFDRWSAPPGALMRTALTQDLAARLSPGAVVYPDAPAPKGTRRLVVNIVALARTADGYTLQLSWSMLPQPGLARQLHLNAPGTDDVAGQVRAVSLMIDQLARDIANTL